MKAVCLLIAADNGVDWLTIVRGRGEAQALTDEEIAAFKARVSNAYHFLVIKK